MFLFNTKLCHFLRAEFFQKRGNIIKRIFQNTNSMKFYCRKKCNYLKKEIKKNLDYILINRQLYKVFYNQNYGYVTNQTTEKLTDIFM